MRRWGDMDEKTVRIHLEEIQKSLERNDAEREVLITLLKGYEGWLRLHGVANGHSPSDQLPLPVEVDVGPGWRPTVTAILQEARGEPVHSKEILVRAKARGLKTSAKNPVSAVDLTARGLPNVEKVGPRLWKWTAKDGGRSVGVENPTPPPKPA